MGRYFIIYFSLITVLCLGFEVLDISSRVGEGVQWQLSDFSLNTQREHSILVMPENFNIVDTGNLTKHFSGNVLSTEPQRKPEESTSDIFHQFQEGNKSYELFCVEKAFYDCLEFLSRYPHLAGRVQKLYVIFPDAQVKNIFNKSSLQNIETMSVKASKSSFLQKMARSLYKLYFEVNHSFEQFVSTEKKAFLAKKIDFIQEHRSKIKILEASPF